MGKDLVSNRRAYHNYEILETYETGIVLQGTEVKSLRESHAHLQEAYVKIVKGELWLIGSTINQYKYGNVHNHEEQRDRKLLMHKREINRLNATVREQGQVLIPLAFFLKQGKIKVRIGRGKGKKLHDKRHSIKEREEKRRMERLRKQ